MGIPLFNLVREDSIETTEDLDYNASSDEQDFFDEIQLVDDTGQPCAVPVNQTFKSLDHRYEFVNGEIGEASKMLRHKIVLNIDYITTDVRRKLLDWMHERARVLFTPGYGDSTEFAWRCPSKTYLGAGSTHTDLTGRWTCTPGGTATGQTHVWDDIQIRGWMKDDTHQKLRLINTPGGHGPVTEAGVNNLADISSNSSPTGTSSPSQTCWVKGGAGSGTLTVSYKANGFGYDPSCEGSLRIVGSSSTLQRYMEYDYKADMQTDGWSPPARATVNASVWLKGSFGADAVLKLYIDGDSETVDLNALDLSSWTRVSIQLTKANATATNGSVLRIMTPEAVSSAASECDYEIGPVGIYYDSSTWVNCMPHWHPGDRVSYDRITIPTFYAPKSGSMVYSFYVHSDFDTTNASDMGHQDCITYFASHGPRLLSYREAGNFSSVRYSFYYGNTSPYSISTTTATTYSGQINTVAAKWHGGGVYLYVNGILMESRTTDNINLNICQGDETMYFLGHSSLGCWPLVPLTCRMDHRLYSDNEMANIHEQLTNPGALESIIPARGRIYRIRQIPSTPRTGDGTTHWLGKLVLEQVDYDENWADETCKEQ
jgi:hypothetical protein